MDLKGKDEAVIRFEQVHTQFPGTSSEVLKGINLSILRGKLTYILGFSGAGKSLLLKHILGLLSPTRGAVYVEEQNLALLSKPELEKVRFRFGMLFQNSALFDDKTVFENVAFPLEEHTKWSRQEIKQKVQKALDNLGVGQAWNKYPNQLSGGMKKRVALARAIIREPSVLLYDEPTTGLDPVNRMNVDDLIVRLRRELELTSVVISHDLSSAVLLADRIAFLMEGMIQFFGTPAEFKVSTKPAIQQFLQLEQQAADLWLKQGEPM